MCLSSSLDQKFPEDQSNDRFARSPQHPAWGLVYYLLLTKCHQVSKKGHIISIRERIEEESMKPKLCFLKILLLIRKHYLHTQSCEEWQQQQHGGCLDQLWNHMGSSAWLHIQELRGLVHLTWTFSIFQRVACPHELLAESSE